MPRLSKGGLLTFFLWNESTETVKFFNQFLTEQLKQAFLTSN